MSLLKNSLPLGNKIVSYLHPYQGYNQSFYELDIQMSVSLQSNQGKCFVFPKQLQMIGNSVINTRTSNEIGS